MSIQQLREQRAAKAKALNEHAKKEAWNPEADQPVYDALMAELDEIDARVKRIQEANDRAVEDSIVNAVAEAAGRIAADTRNKPLSVYAKWLKGGDSALNAEDWATVRNTMSTTTGSEGGFTVDTQVAQTVIDALKAYGGMRAVADVIVTSGFGALSYPTSDGTAETGEIIAENATATDLDIAFGTVALSVYKYSSKVVSVPFELLQDSAIDIEAFVRARLVTRLGRITNTHFTVGTGTGQPNGVVTAAAIGVTAPVGNTLATTYDALVDAQHSLDPAYRNGARWQMHDSSVKVVRKIKDGQQRPIFVPGYEMAVPGGMPDTLLGSPVDVNQDVPVMAANAKSILYGNFKAYVIRDAMAVEMFRFTDSAFTKKGQVGFLAWMRSGGNLIDANAIKALRNSAT
jgi:HK97 family phage major capsid protein